MIKFFRKIRYDLMEKNKTGKYFKYAIGEIVLVVIGILIALSINNWNESRKNKARLITNIQSIAKDIKSDKFQLGKIIKNLTLQIDAGELIIPIMESKDHHITDSLAFIIAFNDMTRAPHINKEAKTWDYFNSSGSISEFPDQELLELLQTYYFDFNSIRPNYLESAVPARLEIRRLKYDLFQQSEHLKFFPTNSPIAPNKESYNSIFNNNQVLPLCRFISNTASYFIVKFESVENQAENIINYIDKNYN